MTTYDYITIVTELKDDGLYVKFCHHEKNYKTLISPYVPYVSQYNIEPIQFIQECLNRAPFHSYEVKKFGDQFEIIFSLQVEPSLYSYAVVFQH